MYHVMCDFLRVFSYLGLDKNRIDYWLYQSWHFDRDEKSEGERSLR